MEIISVNKSPNSCGTLKHEQHDRSFNMPLIRISNSYTKSKIYIKPDYCKSKENSISDFRYSQATEIAKDNPNYLLLKNYLELCKLNENDRSKDESMFSDNYQLTFFNLSDYKNNVYMKRNSPLKPNGSAISLFAGSSTFPTKINKFTPTKDYPSGTTYIFDDTIMSPTHLDNLGHSSSCKFFSYRDKSAPLKPNAHLTRKKKARYYSQERVDDHKPDLSRTLNREHSSSYLVRLKEKLDSDFNHFIKKHRFSSVMIGTKAYEGMSGDYYLKKRKEEEIISEISSKKISISEVNTSLNMSTIELKKDLKPKSKATTTNNLKKINVEPYNHKRTTSNNLIKSTLNTSVTYKPTTNRKSSQELNSSHAQQHVKIIEKVTTVQKRQQNLTPIPQKKRVKTKIDEVEYSQAERAAVLLRRIEYSQGIKGSTSEAQKIYFQLVFETKCITIQRWWRRMIIRLFIRHLKAIKIQRKFRGYITRSAVKQFKRLISFIIPFLEQIAYVVNKRRVNNAFQLLKNKRAFLFHHNFVNKKVLLIQKIVRNYLMNKSFQSKKLKLILIVLFKRPLLDFFNKLKCFRKKDLNKIIKIQSFLKKMLLRNEFSKSKKANPFIYLYLNNNFAAYLRKKKFILNAVKQFKRLTLAKKIREFCKIISSLNGKMNFKAFSNRCESYTQFLLKIKCLSRALNPIYFKQLLKHLFYKWKRITRLTKNYCTLGMKLFYKAFYMSPFKLLKSNMTASSEKVSSATFKNADYTDKAKRIALCKLVKNIYKALLLNYFKRWENKFKIETLLIDFKDSNNQKGKAFPPSENFLNKILFSLYNKRLKIDYITQSKYFTCWYIYCNNQNKRNFKLNYLLGYLTEKNFISLRLYLNKWKLSIKEPKLKNKFLYRLLTLCETKSIKLAINKWFYNALFREKAENIVIVSKKIYKRVILTQKQRTLNKWHFTVFNPSRLDVVKNRYFTSISKLFYMKRLRLYFTKLRSKCLEMRIVKLLKARVYFIQDNLLTKFFAMWKGVTFLPFKMQLLSKVLSKVDNKALIFFFHRWKNISQDLKKSTKLKNIYLRKLAKQENAKLEKTRRDFFENIILKIENKLNIKLKKCFEKIKNNICTSHLRKYLCRLNPENDLNAPKDLLRDIVLINIETMKLKQLKAFIKMKKFAVHCNIEQSAILIQDLIKRKLTEQKYYTSSEKASTFLYKFKNPSSEVLRMQEQIKPYIYPKNKSDNINELVYRIRYPHLKKFINRLKRIRSNLNCVFQNMASRLSINIYQAAFARNQIHFCDKVTKLNAASNVIQRYCRDILRQKQVLQNAARKIQKCFRHRILGERLKLDFNARIIQDYCRRKMKQAEREDKFIELLNHKHEKKKLYKGLYFSIWNRKVLQSKIQTNVSKVLNHYRFKKLYNKNVAEYRCKKFIRNISNRLFGLYLLSSLKLAKFCIILRLYTLRYLSPIFNSLKNNELAGKLDRLLKSLLMFKRLPFLQMKNNINLIFGLKFIQAFWRMKKHAKALKRMKDVLKSIIFKIDFIKRKKLDICLNRMFKFTLKLKIKKAVDIVNIFMYTLAIKRRIYTMILRCLPIRLKNELCDILRSMAGIRK
jgi:hypothetical protein